MVRLATLRFRLVNLYCGVNHTSGNFSSNVHVLLCCCIVVLCCCVVLSYNCFVIVAGQFDVDYLEGISSEASAESELARKSLFVKFDPLVSSAGTKPTSAAAARLAEM